MRSCGASASSGGGWTPRTMREVGHLEPALREERGERRLRGAAHADEDEVGLLEVARLLAVVALHGELDRLDAAEVLVAEREHRARHVDRLPIEERGELADERADEVERLHLELVARDVDVLAQLGLTTVNTTRAPSGARARGAAAPPPSCARAYARRSPPRSAGTAASLRATTSRPFRRSESLRTSILFIVKCRLVPARWRLERRRLSPLVAACDCIVKSTPHAGRNRTAHRSIPFVTVTCVARLSIRRASSPTQLVSGRCFEQRNHGTG